MNRLRLRMRDETGAESVELALLLPMFILLVVGVVPLIQFFSTARELNQLADEAVIYATRVSANPERTSDDASCGDLTRRRSYNQIVDYVGAGATSVDVYVQAAGDPTPDMSSPSSADPCLADPGSRIHVRVTGQFSTGPLAQGLNTLARLINAQGGVVPDQATLDAAAAGYLE